MISTKIKFGAIGLKTAALKLFNKDLARNYMIRTLGEMPGLPAKAAQLMGQRLQMDTASKASPEPMDLSLVKQIIQEESPALADLIDEISPEAHTASLGQVHKANLKDGRIVAIKIQYPKIKEQIEEQVALTFGLAHWGPASKYKLDIEAFSNFVREKLLEEINYIKEGETQTRFLNLWKDSKFVQVPRVYPELSSSRVLTQDYLPAISIFDFKTLSINMRLKAANNLSKFVLTSILRHQLVHTDLQFGNFGFAENGDLVVYDFGSSLKIENQALHGIKKALFLGPAAKSEFFNILVDIGFDSTKLNYLSDKLPQLGEIFLTPLTQPEWDPSKWNLANQISAALGDNKWWFRTAGPPWLLYLMRTMSGWFNAISVLGQTINFPKLLPEYFDPTDIQFALTPPAKVTAPEKSLSQTLNVSVCDGNEEVAFVQLPARSIENIEDLISDQAISQIKEAGVDLQKIKDTALKSNLAPQVLFEARSGTRTYKVWLT